MEYHSVKSAIEKGGSIRQAAKLLGKSYTAVQWWLARNGYRVVQRATIEPIRYDLTEKAQQAVNGDKAE